MSTAAIVAGVGAAASLGGAAIEGNAASNAASTQANAATQNAQMEAGLGQEQLGYENYQNQQNQANEQPFLQSGANGLAQLDYLLGVGNQNGSIGNASQGAGQTLSIPGVNGSVSIPGVQGLAGQANTGLGAYGSLTQGYQGGQFVAPTAAQAAASPGEQFALQQGEGAIQAGAAANGSLLTGGTQNALDQYAQGLASTNYGNVYNQALQTYNTNYNTWANQQANTYNRFASLAGLGQTTAQTLGQQGLQSSQQVANTLNNTGQQVAQQNNNAAAATASGYVGNANAWAGGLSGATSGLSQAALLNELMSQQNSQQGQSDLNQVNQLTSDGNSY